MHVCNVIEIGLNFVMGHRCNRCKPSQCLRHIKWRGRCFMRVCGLARLGGGAESFIEKGDNILAGEVVGGWGGDGGDGQVVDRAVFFLLFFITILVQTSLLNA